MQLENVKSTFLYGKNVEFVLFQNAFNFVEEGRNVWFISREPIKQIPQGIDKPEKEALKLITFLYIKDRRELLKHVNGIHIWYRIPELIILNGFDSYVELNSGSYNSIQPAFLCASVVDAAAACGRKLSKVIYFLAGSRGLGDNGFNMQTVIDLYFEQCVDVSSKINYLVSSVT